MFIFDIIDKKRGKKPLTKSEIDWVVQEYCKGEIDDCQMTSLLMAICINGMDFDESYYLTKAMQNSGKTIKYDFDVVDKHSTGGVSDSTSLILAPTLACLGVKVAKMSGKSLGFSGGTLDKLEVFTGYNYQLTQSEFIKIIKKVGASIIGQTDEMVLADKKLYSLRDRTGTVMSIPLIASSIMSKKLASGSSVILLDVKYGKGAFMKTVGEAVKLANLMVKIGKKDGKKVKAVVTNMNVPLSNGIGSAMEVYSALETIEGKASPLLSVSKTLIEQLLIMSKNISQREAANAVEKAFNDNVVVDKLKEMVLAHGGCVDAINDKSKLLNTKYVYDVKAHASGNLTDIDAFAIANFVYKIKEDKKVERKNYQGVLFLKSLGDNVLQNGTVAKVYSDIKLDDNEIDNVFKNAVTISEKPQKKLKLIEKVIG